MKHKIHEGKGGKQKNIKTTASGAVKKKRKWIPEHKVFEGSVGKGQGFAFRRKQKAKHEYNKLLRKEKKKNPVLPKTYKEQYPDHLKHLYLAEEEKLKKEAWTNRVNRSKLRLKDKEEDLHEDDAANNPEIPSASNSEPDPKDTAEPQEKGRDTSIPMSNRMRKRLLKKTSYQQTMEEFERIIEKRRKKKEEYLKTKQQREEALQRYKQKKMETYQMLCKKTKKGQPNLNLQMEYLLQKIQRTDK